MSMAINAHPARLIDENLQYVFLSILDKEI